MFNEWMDCGLLGEHGGSISCRYNQWKGWDGLEWTRDDSEWKIVKKKRVSVFERSKVPLNVRTLELAEEWPRTNVRTFLLNVRTLV